MSDELHERVAALKSQVDAFRFNPGQKRDEDGKWTDGPGGVVRKLTKKVDDAIGRSIEKGAKRKPLGQRFDEHVAREAKKPRTGLWGKVDDAIERSITRGDKPKDTTPKAPYSETRKARDLKPGDEVQGRGTVKQNLGTDALGDQMILTDTGEHSINPDEDMKIRSEKDKLPRWEE